MRSRRLFLIGSLLLAMLPGQPLANSAAGDDDFSLIDQHGEPFRLQQLRGKVILLSFGYTYCPDICPTELAAISRVLDGLGNKAQKVQGLFISLDPQRDTPAVLKSYLTYFHPDLLGLTGSENTIRQVAGRYRVRYRKHRQPASGYSLDHSANLYIIDQTGELSTVVPYGLPPEHVLRVVRSMLEALEKPQESSIKPDIQLQNHY